VAGQWFNRSRAGGTLKTGGSAATAGRNHEGIARPVGHGHCGRANSYQLGRAFSTSDRKDRSMGLLLALLLVAVLAAGLGLVVWPTVACQNFLTDFITDRLHTSFYNFRLYTNNVTPAAGSVLSNFTEATFAGYASIPGSTITWNAPSVAGLVAQTTGSVITWTNTSAAAVTIYGVFVSDAGFTKLYYAERDPAAPISIPAGGSYSYVPNQQFQSIN
jgi:hypothetical protein